MTAYLAADYWERTPNRRGERRYMDIKPLRAMKEKPIK